VTQNFLEYSFPITTEVAVEYEKPEVTDYGTLQELTATQHQGLHTDVPKGTPVPPIAIFS
jgi:hypothetical protein